MCLQRFICVMCLLAFGVVVAAAQPSERAGRSDGSGKSVRVLAATSVLALSLTNRDAGTTWAHRFGSRRSIRPDIGPWRSSRPRFSASAAPPNDDSITFFLTHARPAAKAIALPADLQFLLEARQAYQKATSLDRQYYSVHVQPMNLRCTFRLDVSALSDIF